MSQLVLHAGGIAILWTGKALDVLVTAVGLSLGLTEANPAARAILETSGPFGLALYAVAICVAVTGVCELCWWTGFTNADEWGSEWAKALPIAAYWSLGGLWLAVALYNALLVLKVYVPVA